MVGPGNINKGKKIIFEKGEIKKKNVIWTYVLMNNKRDGIVIYKE